jgi:hypothetical protein
MAKLSRTAIRERERAEGLQWEDLDRLWREIQMGRSNGWSAGRAFEHLVVRAFALSGLKIEYPYDVPLAGAPLEQIDGMVYRREIPFLIECKDRRGVDITAVAKMRNQLARRPPITMGCIFTSGSFTAPAVVLADFAAPHRITLWDQRDIADAIKARDFAEALERKYHELCMFGLTDHSPHYRENERHVRRL